MTIGTAEVEAPPGAALAVAAALGDHLRANVYGPDAVRALIGEDSVPPAWSRMAPGPGEAALLRRRLPPADPSATLLRLFLCGVPVPAEAASAALRPMNLDSLTAAGVLLRARDGVRSQVRVGWCDERLVLSDWESGHRLRRDHVAGVGAASLTLADLTVREGGADVLDVGTGGGVQALLATSHAASVVGTDVNPRSLVFAALGAAMNGADRIGWRRGSLFAPVAAQRFDLVTANPPFVISPEMVHVFRDGGEAGDALSRQVVTGAAQALRPRGWASVLCSWIHDPRAHWAEPVRGWLEGKGCDAWILRYRSEDPATYATVWAGQGGETSSTTLDATVDRWMAYYAQLGIEAIGTGAVILRRRPDGRGQTWCDDQAEGPSGAAGAEIARAFDHRLRLVGGSAAPAILDAVLVPLDGATLEQSLVRHAGGYRADEVAMRLRPGLGLAASVPARILPAVLALDGRRTIAELIAATGTGDVTDQVTDTLLRLLTLGLVGWRA